MKRTAFAASLGLVLFLFAAGQGDQVLQNGFEGREPLWVQGPHDAAYKETAHALTEETAHAGQRSEHIQLQAESGSYIHYLTDIGRAPVTDELNGTLWVKSNRPGMQLLFRVVLPRERDPNNAGQPLTVLLPGDKYQLVSRWQKLAVSQPVRRLREQQTLLRASLKRDVVVADAYVDQVVLNAYGGPGATDVWTDDLEIGPVLEARPAGPGGSRGTEVPGRPAVHRRAAEVQLKGTQLMVSGQRFFPRMIRCTGTPLETLRDALFNTVVLDDSVPPGLVENAVNLGFWIVPTLHPPEAPDDGHRVRGQLTAGEVFARKVASFLDQDAVLCWDVGSNLSFEQYPALASTIQTLHATDPMRPLAADVWDGYQRYSRSVDGLMLGAHRWSLYTGLELEGFRDWLVQRRRLAAPETFCWTWVQTHLPDWFTGLVYESEGTFPPRPAPGGAPEPIGPQPEQIRLLAYTAISAGYRGLGFWSDRYLADSHTGRDRLLALALLNQELQMLEPLLVGAREPEWIFTEKPDVRAAVLRTDKAVLVLPMWTGKGAQFVPAQGAYAELKLVVPGVPGNYQAWEICPGKMRSYPCKRVLGGIEVAVHDFSLTSALVFTADLAPAGLVVRFQDQQRRMCRLAAQWAHDLAKEEMAKVERVDEELGKLGQVLPDGKKILDKARDALTQCEEHRRNGEHSTAYEDAQVAMRALRTLMRAHWDKAVSSLSTPVASPYAVSFYTLPRHLRFASEIKRTKAAANVLPDGDFELPQNKVPQGWLVQEIPSLDNVKGEARRVTESPLAGKQCLMLKVTSKNPLVSPGALERTYLALHSPAVKLPPGTLVRIRAWVRLPGGIGASPDGALLYDSAGGEPLAVRLTQPTGWKEYTLFRRVPASGKINVTMAVTGLGSAFFDDVRIEPLVAPDSREPQGPRPPDISRTASVPRPAITAPTIPVSAPRR